MRLRKFAMRFRRVTAILKYARGMGISRRSEPLEPVARPSALDAYSGMWVALKDGEVIAHSPSSREVVRQMRHLGTRAEGAVLQRVAGDTEALAVGLG